MARQKSGNDAAPDFEQSLKQLESIVQRLEHEEVPLEESIRLFEQGQGLVRACEQQLKSAENRIRQLLENDAGVLQEQPFEPAEAGATEEGGELSGEEDAAPPRPPAAAGDIPF